LKRALAAAAASGNGNPWLCLLGGSQSKPWATYCQPYRYWHWCPSGRRILRICAFQQGQHKRSILWQLGFHL